MPKVPATKKRTTRPSHEVRTLILKAARELFSARGFDGATTRDIAKSAGVTEALLFTNFGSKAGLFDAAVVSPFSDLVTDYVDSWNHRYSESTPEERISGYIENFYDLATRNRSLLLSALFRRVHEKAVEKDALDPISHLASLMSFPGKEIEALRRDYPEVDAAAEAVTVAGMVLGVALLDDMLFPADSPRLSRTRILTEMKQAILHRVLHRPVAAKDNAKKR